jgi:hypothetical protein
LTADASLLTGTTSPSSKSKKSKDRDRERSDKERDRDKDRDRDRDRDKDKDKERDRDKDRDRDRDRDKERSRDREKKSRTPTPTSNHHHSRGPPLLKTKSLDFSLAVEDKSEESKEDNSFNSILALATANRYEFKLMGKRIMKDILISSVYLVKCYHLRWICKVLYIPSLKSSYLSHLQYCQVKKNVLFFITS